MITIRPRDERGVANFGWLDSRHTFSFGSYYDPQHMGFASLRVINEDKVIPAKGFGTHGHQDMEIISYVLSGELEHRDSMGNGSVIRPGDVQRMSAGTGVRHSEFNASATDPVHFLQIWIMPDQKGLEPSYEEKHYPPETKQGQLKLVGSRDGRENSVIIHQDAELYIVSLSKGDRASHQLKDDRVAWLQIAKGSVLLNDQLLEAGDGAAITDETQIVITGSSQDSEILLFDLAN
ncbi:pirin family protein [Pleurocapsa sp. PCC 7319]|uniref:pirin family protein n=1 Tax=Pleurocapsa sp. PCC 7319 TaxID=118161 RepID=UPI00034A1CFB|nr:pirin family protein [Pleurocapsa sp. PCC 7319]